MEKKWNFAKAEPRWKCHRLFYSAVNGTRHILAVPLHPVSLFAGIALNLPNATWEREWRRMANGGREKKKGRKRAAGAASDKSIRFKFLKGSQGPVYVRGETREQKEKKKKETTRHDAAKCRRIAMVRGTYTVCNIS